MATIKNTSLDWVILSCFSIAVLAAAGCGGCPVCRVLPATEPEVKIIRVTNEFEMQKLIDSAGTKSVVLHFWATACTVCRPEMEELNVFYKTLDKNKTVLYAITSEAAEQVREYAENHQFTMPIVIDERGTMAASYKVDMLPITVFRSASSPQRRFEGPQRWGGAMLELVQR